MSDPKPTPGSVAKNRPVALQKAAPVATHHRGEIWMVTADPASPAIGNEIWSNRPAIIVSNNVLNARGGFATIVYLSTSMKKRTGPTHVEIPAVAGGGTAMALCEQVHTVDVSRLQRMLGTVPEANIKDIDAALALSMSIGRNPNTHGAFRKWEEHVKLHGIDIAKEISALAGQTTDDRVEALTRALTLLAIERDSYRNLFEAGTARGPALDAVTAALGIDRDA